MRKYNINSYHILLDCYGVPNLKIETIKEILVKASEAGRANLLEVKVHSFEGGGFTGVALLSESHITVHTWPEHNYAAFDIFMCGQTKPLSAADWIENFLSADKYEKTIFQRGNGID